VFNCGWETDAEVCPLKAILPYMVTRDTKPGPFFITADNKPLMCQRFYSLLSTLLNEMRLPATDYNTHSFRIGAATTAKDAGISDTYIQMLGRWQSSAYQKYIWTSPSKLAEVTQLLAHHI